MLLAAIGLTAYLIVHWLVLPTRWRRAGVRVMGLVGLAWTAPLSLAALGALALAVYALVLARSAPPGRVAVGAAVVLALGFLALHKYASLTAALLAAGWPARFLGYAEAGAVPRMVGVSYAVFRLIHVAVEATRGRAVRTGPAAFLEYVLFPPSFLSGPIQRQPEFERDVAVGGLDLDAAFRGLRRILTGLCKQILIVSPLAAFADVSTCPGAAPGLLLAWEGLAAYALVVYLDFSAYTDIALGVARLLGYGLPENFDWPYLAPNITEFWRRWHISLSGWLRDYVFLPVSVGLSRLGPLRHRPLATGGLAVFITMLACGAWHGDSARFLLWGAAHGLLCAGHQAWRQAILVKLPARQRKALAANPAYRVACTALTVLLVSLLWVLFARPPGDALQFYGRLVGM